MVGPSFFFQDGSKTLGRGDRAEADALSADVRQRSIALNFRPPRLAPAAIGSVVSGSGECAVPLNVVDLQSDRRHRRWG
jgi:hypothetical protein